MIFKYFPSFILPKNPNQKRNRKRKKGSIRDAKAATRNAEKELMKEYANHSKARFMESSGAQIKEITMLVYYHLNATTELSNKTILEICRNLSNVSSRTVSTWVNDWEENNGGLEAETRGGIRPSLLDDENIKNDLRKFVRSHSISAGRPNLKIGGGISSSLSFRHLFGYY